MRRHAPPALLSLLMSLTVTVAQSGPRAPRPVPGADAQKQAESLVKRVLADGYARAAKDPAARAALARALREQAAQVRDDYALRYVLFREARDAAARAGNVAEALAAVESLRREFAVDAVALRADAILLAEPVAKSDAASQTLAAAALDVLTAALDSDRYDVAARLAPALEASAARTGDDVFLGEARRRAAEARCLHEEYARVARFAERLKANASDSEAAAAVGRFHALQRGDWERGLPLIVKGSETALRTLARRDLDAPRPPREQAELAEAWRSTAASLSGRARTHALLRAAHWCQQVLLDAGADERSPLEKRLREIAAELPEGERLAYYVPLRRLIGHQGNVTGVAIDRTGRRVLSAGADRIVRLWDADTGAERRRLEGHENWVRCAAFSPDGRRALSCGDDDTVRLWELPGGRPLKVLKGHGEWVRSAVFLPDGRVVSAGDDGTLRLWDADTGKEVRRFEGHKGYIWSVAVCRDGSRLLTGGGDGTARLWETDTGKELRRFTGHRGNVQAVALSPDGRRALTGGSDGTMRLWDAEAGTELRRFEGHRGSVWGAAFSPDGKLALSGGADGTARLWDLGSGREVGRLRGHTAAVLAVAFSADGRRLLTGGGDKTVRLWQVLSR